MKFHLTGKFHSGRAVEVRLLDATECDEILERAAKVAGSEGMMIQIQNAMFRAAAKQMIVAYTEPCEAITDSVSWKKVSDPFEMDEKFSKLFTAKDVKVLQKIYADLHEISNAEVDAIVGKGLAASGG